VTGRSLCQSVAEGLEEATEQSLSQGRLHVAVADWCITKVITRCNSLDCPFNCVLYSWGR
jgi:hypothetical protein